MLSQLPAKGSVSLFLAVLLVAVAVAMCAVAVLLMKHLGFFPLVALAGNEKQSGSSGSEK